MAYKSNTLHLSSPCRLANHDDWVQEADRDSQSSWTAHVADFRDLFIVVGLLQEGPLSIWFVWTLLANQINHRCRGVIDTFFSAHP